MPELDDMHSAEDHVALTKSDSTTYTNPTFRGLYVGGAGDVTVKTHETSATVTYKAVPAGTFMPVRCYQLRSTGTTATDVVGLI